MRRRLILAIAGTVLATLVVVGFGTLLLNRLSAREHSRDQLAEEVTGLVDLVSALPGAPEGAVPARGQLRAVAAALRVSDAGVVVQNPDGTITRAELPDGVTLEEIPYDTIEVGQVASGGRGDVVWALTATRIGPARVVVVLSDEVSTSVGPAGRWFLVASLGSLLVGVGVAVLVARRLAEPLREARDTTARIAGGDLSARVPPHATDDGTEVGELSRAINSMAEGLERSRALERQFLLSVSHDLRTPLTSIRGYAEAISDGAVDDPARAADVILGESRRLERLVLDLLDLARLESHRFTLDKRPTDVGELVADVASGFEHRASERSLMVDVVPRAVRASPVDDTRVGGGSTEAGSPLVADIDPDRFAQVVGNLLENACRFAQSRVQVEVQRDRGVVWVSVTDDGPGIPADDLPHVFERLYVVRQRPEAKENGSGLGLAIVRELTTAMGGTVHASSDPGAGARLTVGVPAVT